MIKQTPYLLLAAIFILITGCSPVQNSDTMQPLPTETPALAATATPEPSLTPVPTVTPEPTPSPTPEPTPVPTPEEKGKKVIAKGFYYYKLNDEIKARITGISYPKNDKGCQVKYDDLRYIKLLHYDFDGNVREGELIVNKRVANDVTKIFYELYKKKYKLASVKLVDDYGEQGDDTKSMEANNTSAFCYRPVTGSKKMSHHSFGGAIDINPLYNPYIDGKRVAPANAKPYVNRKKDFPGKIDKNDLAYKLFIKYGWKWGGSFKDYQHFSKDLGYNRYKK